LTRHWNASEILIAGAFFFVFEQPFGILVRGKRKSSYVRPEAPFENNLATNNTLQRLYLSLIGYLKIKFTKWHLEKLH
jgi:hypothetical protein